MIIINTTEKNKSALNKLLLCEIAMNGLKITLTQQDFKILYV